MATTPTRSTSQATRCPACQTVFRVVADQLRVSNGWVRCGRCSEVFDATRQMMQADGSWMRPGDDSPSELQRPAGLVEPTPSVPSHRARQDGLMPTALDKPADPRRSEAPGSERLASKVAAAMNRSKVDAAPVRERLNPPPTQVPAPAPVQLPVPAPGPVATVPAAPAPAPAPRPAAPPPPAAVAIPDVPPRQVRTTAVDNLGASSRFGATGTGLPAPAIPPAADDYINPYVDPFAGPLAKDAPRGAALHELPPSIGRGAAQATPAPVDAPSSSWMHDEMPPGTVAADPFASAPGWTARRPSPPSATTPAFSPAIAPTVAPAPPATPEFSAKPQPDEPEYEDFQPSNLGRPPHAEPRFSDAMGRARAGQRDFEPSFYDEPETPAQPWAATEVASPLEAAPPEASLRPTQTTPDFLRRAEREQRWRKPQMRRLLMAGLVVGSLGLALQMSLAYRDLMAARFPVVKPWLESACSVLGCTVQAARAIESLAVESSGLVRVDKTNLYKLQVTLRNRAGLDLALPALDVTFTDSRGAVISRKVLTPADLGSTIGTLGAGREVTLQTTLQGAGPSPELVAGYTVELFYP